MMPTISGHLALVAVGVAFVLGILIDRAWVIWLTRDD